MNKKWLNPKLLYSGAGILGGVFFSFLLSNIVEGTQLKGWSSEIAGLVMATVGSFMISKRGSIGTAGWAIGGTGVAIGLKSLLGRFGIGLPMVGEEEKQENDKEKEVKIPEAYLAGMFNV